jgi:hypothetical protein
MIEGDNVGLRVGLKVGNNVGEIVGLSVGGFVTKVRTTAMV